MSSHKDPRRAGRQSDEAVPAPGKAAASSEFEALALPHLDSLYRTALRMARNPDEAEDLVQETFMKAFRSFATFEPETNFRAWLFKILTNSYINRYRKQQVNPARTSLEDIGAFLASDEAGEAAMEPAEAPAMVEAAMDERFDQEVKHALDELPEEFRQVVVMALVEGMSYKEIAGALECPLGTVMSRLYRGRQLLRRRLGDYARAMGYRDDAAEAAK
ncbi:MAG TPA: sigma-70 family RNA polymerase sigma factor [Planctomycetota bacterium]|nr:sigma-70 family RNA polymerase sigma factor [Planctomycetota bacterium]